MSQSHVRVWWPWVTEGLACSKSSINVALRRVLLCVQQHPEEAEAQVSMSMGSWFKVLFIVALGSGIELGAGELGKYFP